MAIRFDKLSVQRGDTVEFLSDALTDKGPCTMNVLGFVADTQPDFEQVDMLHHGEEHLFLIADIQVRLKAFHPESACGRLWQIE